MGDRSSEPKTKRASLSRRGALCGRPRVRSWLPEKKWTRTPPIPFTHVTLPPAPPLHAACTSPRRSPPRCSVRRPKPSLSLSRVTWRGAWGMGAIYRAGFLSRLAGFCPGRARPCRHATRSGAPTVWRQAETRPPSSIQTLAAPIAFAFALDTGSILPCVRACVHVPQSTRLPSWRLARLR
jgi:hypothetical protein